MIDLLKRKALKNIMSKGMTDMGYKSEMMEGSPSTKKGKSRIEYPSMHIYRKVPSWLMGKELGNKLKIVALGKVVSKSIDENNDGKRESATVEIQKLGEE